MTGKTLVVAPHPDDEILGCGGTLLRRKAEGAALGWLIVTGISERDGWPADQVQRRNEEIATVAAVVGFDEVFNLRLPTTQIDTLPMRDVVDQFSAVFRRFQPTEVLMPHCSDAHSDHRVVFDATTACAKWFRCPSLLRLLAYETLSETDAGVAAEGVFNPNCFIDINGFLERKLEIMAIYQSELGAFPFPRSTDAIRALATLRGAASGFIAAEGFQLLRERQ